MKKVKLIALLILGFVIFSNCDDEEKVQFGITETGFETDSIYWATTDGLLVIQSTANISPAVVGYVYSDFDIDSTTLVGSLYANDNATYPIMKNYYWRVSERTFSDPNIHASFKISWTPMN